MYIAGEYTFWCRDLPPTYTRQGVFKFSSAILVSWIFKDFCFPVAALSYGRKFKSTTCRS